MLYIRVELWPWGERERRKTLAEMVIANDGTGSNEEGNYRIWQKTDSVKLLDNPVFPEESLTFKSWIEKLSPWRVEKHNRESSIWLLIKKAIENKAECP
jgi:hypothetical protein